LNGYVKFETPDGDVLAINADSVSFVRRYRGTDQAGAVFTMNENALIF